jgi:protein-tyrosine phosphatase
MAQSMLAAELTARAVPATVTSAGTAAADGRAAPPEVIATLAARGLDAAGHRSRAVTRADLAGADLVLGMTREHVRHAVVLDASAWPRAFTLRELVGRGRRAGPRAVGEELGDWLARAAAGRTRTELLGQGPADDVADPAGGPLAGYADTAELLGQCTRELAALGWPR